MSFVELPPFTLRDAKLTRTWAVQLTAWLLLSVRVTHPPTEPLHESVFSGEWSYELIGCSPDGSTHATLYLAQRVRAPMGTPEAPYDPGLLGGLDLVRSFTENLNVAVKATLLHERCARADQDRTPTVASGPGAGCGPEPG